MENKEYNIIIMNSQVKSSLTGLTDYEKNETLSCIKRCLTKQSSFYEINITKLNRVLIYGDEFLRNSIIQVDEVVKPDK